MRRGSAAASGVSPLLVNFGRLRSAPCPPRDRGYRRPHAPSGQDTNEQPPWAIVYYQSPDGTVPALESVFSSLPGTND